MFRVWLDLFEDGIVMIRIELTFPVVGSDVVRSDVEDKGVALVSDDDVSLSEEGAFLCSEKCWRAVKGFGKHGFDLPVAGLN